MRGLGDDVAAIEAAGVDQVEDNAGKAGGGSAATEVGLRRYRVRLPAGADPAAAAALLKALRETRDCCGREWIHGVQFIRDSYFEDHARELADDIGAIDKDAKWPCSCIDWEEAADQLKQDYSTTEIGGISFHYRD